MQIHHQKYFASPFIKYDSQNVCKKEVRNFFFLVKVADGYLKSVLVEGFTYMQHDNAYILKQQWTFLKNFTC